MGKSPQKMIFNQLITEEPKYQAKALIVATDTINSGGSYSTVIVVTIPSLLYAIRNFKRVLGK